MWTALLVLAACNGGGGGSAPAPAPVAVADSYVFSSTVLLNVVAGNGVLSNDSGAPTTAVLNGAPAHAASFTLNADGSFTYKSADGTSSDAFSYRATNASGSSSVVAVNLAPNTAPVALNACKSTPANTSVSGTLTANDEPASQPDTYSLVLPDPVGPFKGSVTVNQNGTFTYTPNNPSYVGMDKFKFKVTDQFNLSSTGIATVLINGAVRIMPLGDSITQGVWYGGSCGDGNCPPSNERIGYRKTLLDLLRNPTGTTHYPVTFVGSMQNGSAAGLTANVDDYHEGHPGYCAGPNGANPTYCTTTAGNLADNVSTWLNTNQADVILLHAGTNSFVTSANDMSTLLNNINAWAGMNYPVTVFVARIIPTISGTPDVNTFNNAVATNITNNAASRTHITVFMVDEQAKLRKPGDPVTSNFADSLLMASDLHPNSSGYDMMADQWKTDMIVSGVLPANCP